MDKIGQNNTFPATCRLLFAAFSTTWTFLDHSTGYQILSYYVIEDGVVLVS